MNKSFEQNYSKIVYRGVDKSGFAFSSLTLTKWFLIVKTLLGQSE
jgi:hypothetical protein